MNIGIIGMGFVGGTTANVLERAHKIFPYDKYKSPHNSSSHLEELANQSEVIFVSVPTPMKPSGEIDYSSIHNSLDALSGYITNPSEKYVVIRSTAVSGTTDDLSKKYSFQFAFNPEFLREKHALEDMEKTDRIVIGANSSEIHRKVAEFTNQSFPTQNIFFTDTRTAEMVKYAANVSCISSRNRK
jgi:UDPglucose 6-dehydrogenase